jgi:hypothetical protein
VKQDNERALQLLRGLTKASPQRARSFKLLAEFYHTVNKDVPSAIKIYQKVMSNTFPVAFALIGFILRLLRASGPPAKSVIRGQVSHLASAQKLTRMRILPHIVAPIPSCNVPTDMTRPCMHFVKRLLSIATTRMRYSTLPTPSTSAWAAGTQKIGSNVYILLKHCDIVPEPKHCRS